MTTRSIRAAIAAFCCCVPALTQTTWIVDEANGPGAHFTSLAAAVAAAGGGDTILVRSGSYPIGGIVIDKPLSILGIDNNVSLTGGSSLGPSMHVVDLQAGQAFVLRNVRLGGSLFGPDLSVTDCDGAVLIERVEGTLGPQFIQDGPRITFSNCRQAHVHNAFVRGGGILNFSGTTGTLTSSVIEGEIQAGVAITNGNVTVDGCIIDKDPLPLQFAPPLFVDGGTVRIARSDIRAHDVASNALPAIGTANQATLWIDPTTILVPATGQPAIGGGATVVNGEIASLARGPNPATPTLELLGKVAAVHATFVSLPSATAVTPFGELWLDPAPNAYLLLDLGVFQTRTHSLPLPTPALPSGIVFTLQSILLDPNLSIGNGVLYVTP